MQTRLHLCFFFLIITIRAIRAQQDLFNDDDLFATADPLSDFPTLDNFDPDLIAWNTDNQLAVGEGEPSLFGPDPPLLPEGSDDETNIFLTAGCSSATDTLKARGDGQTPALSCPNTGGLSAPVPQLPTTLDELTNQLPPTSNEGEKKPDLGLVPGSWWPSPLPLTSSDEEDPNCPKFRPKRVCCLCDRAYAYSWCHDCLLGRLFLSTFFSIYQWRILLISSMGTAPAYV